MQENDRKMWADLYHFYEKAVTAKPDTPEWRSLGEEMNRLLDLYDDNPFMRDVLATTIGYLRWKYGESKQSGQ